MTMAEAMRVVEAPVAHVWSDEGDDLHLFCGDGPGGLAALGIVDAVITDPPYAVFNQPDIAKLKSLKTGHEGHLRRNAEWELESPMAYRALMRRLLTASASRVMNGWVHVFCADRWLSHLASMGGRCGLKYRLPFVWCKTNPPPRIRSRQWRAATELAAVFSCGTATMDRCPPNYFECPFEPGQTRWHETQKPGAVLDHLIEHYTKPGDLVVDPFAGSGSTLMACRRLKRRCVAIELDPKRCAMIRAAMVDGPRAARAMAAQAGIVGRPQEADGQLTMGMDDV